MGTVAPRADLEFGSERVRQADQIVITVRVIKPRPADRHRVSDVEPLVNRPAMVVGVHGDTLKVEPLIARRREEELHAMTVMLDCLPAA